MFRQFVLLALMVATCGSLGCCGRQWGSNPCCCVPQTQCCYGTTTSSAGSTTYYSENTPTPAIADSTTSSTPAVADRTRDSNRR
jgi:hypothetical protein